jgi:hypothetical protein
VAGLLALTLAVDLLYYTVEVALPIHVQQALGGAQVDGGAVGGISASARSPARCWQASSAACRNGTWWSATCRLGARARRLYGQLPGADGADLWVPRISCVALTCCFARVSDVRDDRQPWKRCDCST